jgi:hypothetical protein
MAYLLLYVDDIILTTSSSGLLCHLTDQLHSSMTDLGDLSFFLCVSVTRSPVGMLLSQRQSTIELLQHTGMLECNPCLTPIDMRCKLSANEGPSSLTPPSTTASRASFSISH